jgi:hypothetical protein
MVLLRREPTRGMPGHITLHLHCSSCGQDVTQDVAPPSGERPDG